MAQQLSMTDEGLSPHARAILDMQDLWTPDVPENGLMSLMLSMEVSKASRRDLWLLHVGMKQIVAGFKAIGEVPPRNILDRDTEVRLAFLAYEGS